jgi:hypothetical protein
VADAPGVEIERESGAMPGIMAERIIEMGLKVLSLSSSITHSRTWRMCRGEIWKKNIKSIDNAV